MADPKADELHLEIPVGPGLTGDLTLGQVARLAGDWLTAHLEDGPRLS